LEVVRIALGLSELRAIDTGGNVYDAERQQWDSGNNLVAIESGVVIAYDRNTTTNSLLRKPVSRSLPSSAPSSAAAAAAAIA
jgi:arginine deiminase